MIASMVLSVAVFAAKTAASQAAENPLSKAIDLLQRLDAKLSVDAATELKDFEAYMAWCERTDQEKGFEIQTHTSSIAALSAGAAKAKAAAEAASAEVDDLAGKIAGLEADLKAATALRKSESADFSAAEKDLTETIDVLTRAISILSAEAAKNPAFLQQASSGASFNRLADAISAVVSAAGFPGADRQKLMGLIQARRSGEDAEDEDAELAAPAAAAYKTHSGSIIDVLEDLKAKALEELSDARAAEGNARHNFEMLRQSLTDQLEAENKSLSQQRALKGEQASAAASATADLKESQGDLEAAQDAKSTAGSQCEAVKSAHEETVASRAAEAKAIKQAIEILSGSGPARGASQVYGFVQLGSMVHSRSQLAGMEVVAMVRRLAKQQHSASLSQLASRIQSLLRTAQGEDPFAKVKGLIRELIGRLTDEAAAEASHKAYCDEETKKTAAKIEELEELIAKLTARIDSGAAEAASAAEDGRKAQGAAAALRREQAEMDKLRGEERAVFATTKTDLEDGIRGVAQALQILREYYGTEAGLLQQPSAPATFSKSEGSGSSIIGVLEVLESDMSRSLALAKSEEDTAETAYQRITQENKQQLVALDKEAEYKQKEARALEKRVSENSADRDSTQEELSAVQAYAAKLRDQCVDKAETYAERKARREAEIAGLKEALTYLADQSFLQRSLRRSKVTLHRQ